MHSIKLLHSEVKICTFAFRLTFLNLSFFLIGIVGGGVQWGQLGTVATNRPIVPTKYSEKTCPSATVSITNPTYSARARTRAAAMGRLSGA
jgi:hypothetical protein